MPQRFDGRNAGEAAADDHDVWFFGFA